MSTVRSIHDLRISAAIVTGRTTWSYARPRLRHWSVVWFATFDRFDDVFWLATPWTPPLWQRELFLVN